MLRPSQVILWRKQFENCENFQEEKRLKPNQLEAAKNRKKLAEMPEYAKFKQRDISIATREKIIKMSEKEREENGIKGRVSNLNFDLLF